MTPSSTTVEYYGPGSWTLLGAWVADMISCQQCWCSNPRSRFHWFPEGVTPDTARAYHSIEKREIQSLSVHNRLLHFWISQDRACSTKKLCWWRLQNGWMRLYIVSVLPHFRFLLSKSEGPSSNNCTGTRRRNSYKGVMRATCWRSPRGSSTSAGLPNNVHIVAVRSSPRMKGRTHVVDLSEHWGPVLRSRILRVGTWWCFLTHLRRWLCNESTAFSQYYGDLRPSLRGTLENIKGYHSLEGVNWWKMFIAKILLSRFLLFTPEHGEEQARSSGARFQQCALLCPSVQGTVISRGKRHRNLVNLYLGLQLACDTRHYTIQI